jgi:hypothetical protein
MAIGNFGYRGEAPRGDSLTFLTLTLAMAVTTVHALRRRSDVYPLAAVMGTFIIISLVWLAQLNGFHDEGMLLMLALWLIGTSTAAGRVLTVLNRRWRAERPA